MSAHSSALAPAGDGTFLRRSGAPAKIAVASIAVVGVLVAGAAVFALSRASAAGLAPQGATGHAAPVTSTIERALESGSVAIAGTSTSSTIGPLTVIVTSGITGLDARVPAASSPMEQAIDSGQGATTAASTLMATGSTGFDVRVPAASSPMEQAVESGLGSAAATSTTVVDSESGLAHRMPLR